MTEPTFPDVMLTTEVAAVMRVAHKSIWNALAAGTFLPLPFATHPYRWRGEDIAKWYRGELTEAVDKLRHAARMRRAS